MPHLAAFRLLNDDLTILFNYLENEKDQVRCDVENEKDRMQCEVRASALRMMHAIWEILEEQRIMQLGSEEMRHAKVI